jgi:hypothetical protein
MKAFSTWTAHPWGITEDKTKSPIARVSPLLDATESEPVGRLIAAAPQMLAALRAALEAMGDSYDATDAASEEGAALWDQVANAIESATGETADY